MTCGIRRTSCVHPVGRKTSWKTSPKPLVPQALRGLELPHAENDGRATRRQLRRRTDWGNSDRPTRFDWDSRPRRERSAGHGARSSESDPRPQEPGNRRPRAADLHEARGGCRQAQRTWKGSSEPDQQRSERETASAQSARGVSGNTDAGPCGRGNPTAGPTNVTRAPRSHTSRGPHQFPACLTSRHRPARHDEAPRSCLRNPRPAIVTLTRATARGMSTRVTPQRRNPRTGACHGAISLRLDR